MQVERLIHFSQSALFLTGIIKLLLVMAFFMSFGLLGGTQPAFSQDKCEGVNLVEKMRAEDPEKYQAVLAEAAKTLNGEGIFWKVEKDGFETSWLYGTMHLARPTVSTIPEDAKTAIRQSSQLVVETTDVLDAQASAKAMASLAHLTFLTEGNLRDYVADDLEDDLEKMLAARGIPMVLAERMRPWVIATAISLSVCEAKLKESGAKVLDQALAEYAKDNGKSIKGLETAGEQMTAMASIPVEQHVAMLEDTVRSRNSVPDVVQSMIHLYGKGQIGAIFPLIRTVMPNSSKGEGAESFQRILIQQRNKVMLERSLPILDENSAFIAVGALHLPGETGLVNLLRQEGFTVTRQR